MLIDITGLLLPWVVRHGRNLCLSWPNQLSLPATTVYVQNKIDRNNNINSHIISCYYCCTIMNNSIIRLPWWHVDGPSLTFTFSSSSNCFIKGRGQVIYAAPMKTKFDRYHSSSRPVISIHIIYCNCVIFVVLCYYLFNCLQVAVEQVKVYYIAPRHCHLFIYKEWQRERADRAERLFQLSLV